MIILYVPFERHKAGDLVNLVNWWKHNQNTKLSAPLLIIYHKDKINYDAIGEISNLYICAHGYSDDSPLGLGNYSCLATAELLKIPEVADHFNQDFVPIAYKIMAIHLYCCGSQKKNKQITELFRQNMLRPECPLYYYNGILTIADLNGTQWSFGVGKPIPVESVLAKLFYVEPENLCPERKSIKQETFESGLEQARIDRRNRFFDRQKNDREERLWLKRRAAPKEEVASEVVLTSTA